ncbi:unnamed protein product [Paramecium sonneborni]|uniref:Cyclin-dependent kinase 2 homolog n=1 Tax=Paramecium sonneborni TaxID=65129 RepID=A0A8S1NVA5_9CILI|nr:unnamed protein product [Paramecium sonneborni]
MLGNLDVQICRTTTSQLAAQNLEETYIIQKHVGQGKYGQVFKAQNKQNKQIVALKKIKQEIEANGFPRTAMREIQLLSSLKHENIVRFKEVVVQSKNTYLVLEYMDTDLHNVLQSRIVFSLDQVRCLMLQILEALCYLHSQNIYHRDLKRIHNYILKLIIYYITIRDKQRFAILEWPMNFQKRDHKLREYQFPNTELLKYIWAISTIVRLICGQLASSFLSLLQSRVHLCWQNLNLNVFLKLLIFVELHWKVRILFFLLCSLPHYHDFINGPKERTLRKYLHANQVPSSQLIDLVDKMLILNPAKRITAKEALKHQYFQTRIFIKMPRIEQDSQPPKDPPIQKKVKQEQQQPLIQGLKINKCI